MNIDLGKKSTDLSGCVPNQVSGNDKVYYPSLYLEGIADLGDIPEEGELTVKFKRSSLTVRERDGKKSVSLELEVRAITGVEGSSVDDSKTAADALDEIRNTLAGADEGDE